MEGFIRREKRERQTSDEWINEAHLWNGSLFLSIAIYCWFLNVLYTPRIHCAKQLHIQSVFLKTIYTQQNALIHTMRWCSSDVKNVDQKM